jgi:oligoendopeptidase F
MLLGFFVVLNGSALILKIHTDIIIQTKEEIMENKFEWKFTDIYKTKEDYKEDIKKVKEKLEEIVQYRGKLKDSSENIYKCYKIYEEIVEMDCKIYAYGMLQYHRNMTNQEAVELFKEAEELDNKIDEKTAFMVPELTDMDTATLEKYMKEDKSLQRYSRRINEILENKKHILSKEIEEVLSKFSDTFNGCENAYSVLTNAEIKFPSIKDSDGNELEVNEAEYSKLLENKDREVRRKGATTLVSEYGKYINTITELYLNTVKQDTKIAKLRNYKSSLEKAVIDDEATVKVYETLLKTINEHIGINHEYTSLKKKLLNLPDIHMYDMSINPFNQTDTTMDIEDAEELVLKALAPLGTEYVNKLKEAFNSNWMDAYLSPNKRGGAYNMPVYGVHPYVLLNYTGTNFDVSSIAHEFGHAMHSYYSDKNQNVLEHSYTLLLAEIASTVNEILLAQYRLDNSTAKQEKIALLYDRIETVKSTLFTQAMFAEFEQEVHSRIENGEILNAEKLGNIYVDLCRKYYGEDLVIDEYNKYNWTRVNHFFRCFYVYKYATGISCAIDIASRILSGEEGLVEKYINMLKMGGSKKSLDILKTVGIDLEDSRTYENALKFYKNDIEKLEELI